MTKMRVHELAKELGVDNKDLMEALKKKDVEVKSHMSSLEDNVVADLKKEFGKSAGVPSAECKKFRKRIFQSSGGSTSGCRTRRSTSDRCSRKQRTPGSSIRRKRRPSGWCVRRKYSPSGRHGGTDSTSGASAGKSRADKQQSGSRREPWTERSTLTGEQKSGKPSAGQRKSAPWG